MQVRLLAPVKAKLVQQVLVQKEVGLFRCCDLGGWRPPISKTILLPAQAKVIHIGIRRGKLIFFSIRFCKENCKYDKDASTLFFEQVHAPLPAGMYFAPSFLGSKGSVLAPRGAMGSGSSSQAYPPSHLQRPFLFLTVPSFNKVTLSFTRICVLKFFLCESRTW